jgi:hypothetical protein
MYCTLHHDKGYLYRLQYNGPALAFPQQNSVLRPCVHRVYRFRAWARGRALAAHMAFGARGGRSRRRGRLGFCGRRLALAPPLGAYVGFHVCVLILVCVYVRVTSSLGLGYRPGRYRALKRERRDAALGHERDAEALQRVGRVELGGEEDNWQCRAGEVECLSLV